MKFAVGVMLTAFGIFWAGEGAGVSWPHQDAALLALIPAIVLFAAGCVALLKQHGPGTGPAVRAEQAVNEVSP
jgi:uncharacterized membrane protein